MAPFPSPSPVSRSVRHWSPSRYTFNGKFYARCYCWSLHFVDTGLDHTCLINIYMFVDNCSFLRLISSNKYIGLENLENFNRSAFPPVVSLTEVVALRYFVPLFKLAKAVLFSNLNATCGKQLWGMSLFQTLWYSSFNVVFLFSRLLSFQSVMKITTFRNSL